MYSTYTRSLDQQLTESTQQFQDWVLFLLVTNSLIPI